jgi:proteic killer suppression protein
MLVREVRLSKSAKSDLRKVPAYIADKLGTWVDAVERDGLHEVRKVPGYHDEPLKGARLGQRSIRLSRHYRAISTVKHEGTVEFASVEEVSKHGY